MSDACTLHICDGTGWVEVDDRSVAPCACRAGAEPPRPCQVPGCEASATSDLPACRRHWSEIPLELRRAVRRSWKAWLESRAPLSEYEEACREAVDAAGQEALL